MAITTNASYVPTLTEFATHWEDVDAERGAAGPLVLSSGATVTNPAALKSQLVSIETELQSRLNDQQIARGGINQKKAALLYWFGRWTGVFDAYFANTQWGGARPLAVQASTTVEEFVKPMLDLKDLWTRFNGLTGPQIPTGLTVPIVLIGETAGDTLTMGDFVNLIVELRQFADDETTAISRVRRSRSKRTFVQKQAYELMKLYRQAMPGSLPGGNELQATLPRLTPADTGSTPDAVNASAIYVSGSTSKTTYEASSAADLKEYQLRGVVGEDWDEEDAVTIATNAKDAPREFTVDFGLTQPGTTIVLKVYVITEDGRERGSAPMVVTRPA